MYNEWFVLSFYPPLPLFLDPYSQELNGPKVPAMLTKSVQGASYVAENRVGHRCSNRPRRQPGILAREDSKCGRGGAYDTKEGSTYGKPSITPRVIEYAFHPMSFISLLR